MAERGRVELRTLIRCPSVSNRLRVHTRHAPVAEDVGIEPCGCPPHEFSRLAADHSAGIFQVRASSQLARILALLTVRSLAYYEALQVGLPKLMDAAHVDDERLRERQRVRLVRLEVLLHAGFLRRAVVLAHVAGEARADDVLPGPLATLAARDDVVVGQQLRRLASHARRAVAA